MKNTRDEAERLAGHWTEHNGPWRRPMADEIECAIVAAEARGYARGVEDAANVVETLYTDWPCRTRRGATGEEIARDIRAFTSKPAAGCDHPFAQLHEIVGGYQCMQCGATRPATSANGNAMWTVKP